MKISSTMSDRVSTQIKVKISSTMSDRASTQIKVKISSTMSDRASTQIKFNERLEEYRKDILPLTVENSDSMSEAQQLSLGKRCNFFCGLHALVHLAEGASSAAMEADNGFLGEQLPIMDGSFLKAKEPGATRLIRTACKPRLKEETKSPDATVLSSSI